MTLQLFIKQKFGLNSLVISEKIKFEKFTNDRQLQSICTYIYNDVDTALFSQHYQPSPHTRPHTLLWKRHYSHKDNNCLQGK